MALHVSIKDYRNMSTVLTEQNTSEPQEIPNDADVTVTLAGILLFKALNYLSLVLKV